MQNVCNSNSVSSPMANGNPKTSLLVKRNMTSSSVPEACLKETLPCEMSPVGYYLSPQIKNKIWNGQFVDILALLPSVKEYINRSDNKIR